MKEKLQFFITRHSKKPVSGEKSAEGYPGISEKGVSLAKERVADIIHLVENLPDGTIVPLVGVSPLERTHSTMDIYSKGVKEGLKNKENIITISKEEIDNFYKETGGANKTIEKINKKIIENPTAKVVIEFPLTLKEFSDPRWFNKEDNDKPENEKRLSPYVDHLGGVKKFREKRNESIMQWFDEKGIVNNEQLGPNPEEIAQGHVKALKRLADFTQKIFPNKPLYIVIVGHSLEMDSFFTYLANDGKITSEGFKKIGGQELKETEPAVIKLNNDGGIELNYREKNFVFNPIKKNEK